MSDIMTSREFVTYFTDILFGDRSYKVFTDVPQTDNRYRRIGKDGIISDFLNPKKTKGKLTDKVSECIYERCRYYIFPEEYCDSPEDMLVKKNTPTPKEFVNKFTCLFSCLFDYNLGMLKLYDDDPEEELHKKKTITCTLIKNIIGCFKNKIEIDISKLRNDCIELYVALREGFERPSNYKFTQEELNSFESIILGCIYEKNRFMIYTDEYIEYHYNNQLKLFQIKINDYMKLTPDLIYESYISIEQQLDGIFTYGNYFKKFTECKRIIEHYFEKIELLEKENENNYIPLIPNLKLFLIKARKYFLFRILIRERFLVN